MEKQFVIILVWLNQMALIFKRCKRPECGVRKGEKMSVKHKALYKII